MREKKEEVVDGQTLKKAPPPNETQISMVCPDCGGALFESKSGGVAHFKCHVGHSYSPESLTEAHKEALEKALWTAMRTLNERITMHRQFLRRDRNAGEEQIFKRFEESANSAERDVQLLREIISRI